MFTLIACLGMWGGICVGGARFEDITLAQCEAIKAQYSKESIGNGFVLCFPFKVKEGTAK